MLDRTAPSPAPALLRYTDGQLEALKWLALGAMFVDHFGRHLLGYAQDTWVFGLGRIAFPLFALVLGLNLARDGDRAARAARTARRLALWCAVAIAPSVWARGDPMVVNVLATLGLGALLCWAFASAAPLWLRLALCIVAAAASDHVEFGLAGVFLVPAIYLCRTGPSGAAALLAGLLLFATAWLNGSYGGWAGWLGTLAALPVALIVRWLPVAAPRLQLGFYLVYPLHLALIGAWKTGLSA